MTSPSGEIPAELRDEMERLGDLVTEAKGRSDYALEVAHDMSLPTKMLAFMSWQELLPNDDGPAVVGHHRHPRPASPACSCNPIGDRPTLRALAAGGRRQWGGSADPRSGRGARRRSLDLRRRSASWSERCPQHRLGSCRRGDRLLLGRRQCDAGWLQAVAYVFSQREDVDVAYGVSIAEHKVPGDLGEHGWWPSFWQLPWSRELLLQENVTDIGAIAHRRDLEEARFDEDVPTAEDWVLLLRLTSDREALAIPALSHAYVMDAPDRVSRDPGYRAGLDEIRRRYEGT
jgi:hypothetical protein